MASSGGLANWRLRSEGVDLSGKRAIVTGGASGIGLETAKALSAAGAAVTLAVRRPAAARTVAEDIRVSTGNDGVEVRSLDVSDLASVRRFCADWTGPLQILINNAGIMALQDLHRTPEGWEMRFATNFLSHFALTTGFMPPWRQHPVRVSCPFRRAPI
jgi:NAD(P)-dependent dehydrogenase (short-subunit alcohol dehydrogenase family)